MPLVRAYGCRREHQEAAHKLIDFILRPDIHRWVAENILYKVPNKAAMDAVDPSLLETFPNMAIAPAELLGTSEAILDIGDAAGLYTEIATEIAAQ